MDKIQTKDTKTQDGYKTALNNFENFCMEKYGHADCIEELKQHDNDDVFEFLQAWINWNIQRAPRTVLNWFSRIKKYLHYRGIKLHPQDVKENLEFQTPSQEELYPLSHDDIKTIIKEMRYKHKTQFVCQASSMMRIGEIVQLRKKHLVLGNQNIIVKIPPTIAKFKKGRTTFFSKEASRMLRPILRKKSDDDLIFGTSPDSRNSSINSEQILRRILVKTSLDMKYESNNRFMINTHSFRAYGITKISRHDPNLAKKLAGQKGYLDQYDRMTDDEKVELYQKYEIDLIIDDKELYKLEMEKKDKEISKLKTKELQINQLQKQLEDFKKESFSEIEKLKWINQIKSHYLEKGMLPDIERKDGKTSLSYKSLDELE